MKAGVGTAGVVTGIRAASAEPGHVPPAAREPAPKAWFDQLLAPGETIRYTGERLRSLIFPLGGIGTGTIWLDGSGRLVNWQIFNNIQKDSRVDESFFAVRIEQEGAPPIVRALQAGPLGQVPGLRNLLFVGRYPVAEGTFDDPDLPVRLELEAYNPLIPLEAGDSGIPCAIFTVRAVNRTDRPVRVSMLGSLQNAVGHPGRGSSAGTFCGPYGGNVNRLVREEGMTAVAMSAEPGKPAEVSPAMELLVDHQHMPVLDESPVVGLHLASVSEPQGRAGLQTVYWIARGDLKQLGGTVLLQAVAGVREYGAVLLLSGASNPLLQPVPATVVGDVRRREVLFATFDGKSFGTWDPKGDAFRGPRSGTVGTQQRVTGFLGERLVNTFDPSDLPKGTLTSPIFTIRERYISFLLGGGEHPGACCINLKVDGKIVRTETGRNSEHLVRVDWDVADLADLEAQIEIVDSKSNPWGHILVDDVRFSNLPTDAVTVEEADAWNAMLEDVRAADPMTAVGLGRGKAMRIEVDLGVAPEGADPVVHRDKTMALIASIAGVEFRPQVGRPGNAPSSGTMCLATPEEDASVRVGWADRGELLHAFTEQGRLDTPAADLPEAKPQAGPTPPGQTINAALCVDRTLGARASAEATFVYAWHFPHQYYPQNNYRVNGNTAVEVGNMYANWFYDGQRVARYVLTNHDRLRTRTLAFRDAMFDTTLPQYFVDAVAANVSILRSPTCFWTLDGTFFGFEGCLPSGGGCCPMNCNHVWNYEQTLARLWPELERDMRKTELKFHQRDDGGTNHRVAVPRGDSNKHAPPVADGQCGAVLKAYREHLQSRDRRFLDDYWPSIKKAIEFAIREWDADGDGVMEKPQFNTYDREIYGHNSFVSSLYLAALRAAEEMARLSNDDTAAGRYRALFEKGSSIIAETLFDGEYYIQKADDINLGYGQGCWSDQVVGQWWARILDLGDILPNAQVRSALAAVFKHNFLWTQQGFEGTQRFLQFADGEDKGLLCGSWPKGGRPDDPILYRDEVWTGVEYQVAAHKLYEGQIDEALAIVKGARERYDGRKKSPWNEVECGDYYARALSSWSLLLAAQGYAHDGPAKRLAFDPRLAPDDHRSLFTTADGWGRFEQKRADGRQTNVLTVLAGWCELRQLRLGLPAEVQTVRGSLRRDDEELVAEIDLEGGVAVVKLSVPIAVAEGQRLAIQLDWS